MEPCITAGTGIEETGFGYTMSLVSGKYKMIILYWLVEYSVLPNSSVPPSAAALKLSTVSFNVAASMPI